MTTTPRRMWHFGLCQESCTWVSRLAPAVAIVSIYLHRGTGFGFYKHRQRTSPFWKGGGRCYDRNVLRFLPIVDEIIGVSIKNQC
jgi:hypothetical protein